MKRCKFSVNGSSIHIYLFHMIIYDALCYTFLVHVMWWKFYHHRIFSSFFTTIHHRSCIIIHHHYSSFINPSHQPILSTFLSHHSITPSHPIPYSIPYHHRFILSHLIQFHTMIPDPFQLLNGNCVASEYFDKLHW